MSHYCHNCGYHSKLIDGVYCRYCLNFWYTNGRFPRPGEK